jgi:hypothetical protein
MRKFRPCKVELAPEELVTKAKRIEIVESRIAERKAALDAIKEETNAEVKELEASRSKLIKEIAERHETREVEVIEKINPDRRVVEIVRADNGDRVDERPITEADQQGRLGFDDVDGTVREEKDELEGLGASDLRKRAKELGIKVPAKAKATEILALIRSAQPLEVPDEVDDEDEEEEHEANGAEAH